MPWNTPQDLHQLLGTFVSAFISGMRVWDDFASTGSTARVPSEGSFNFLQDGVRSGLLKVSGASYYLSLLVHSDFLTPHLEDLYGVRAAPAVLS